MECLTDTKADCYRILIFIFFRILILIFFLIDVLDKGGACMLST